MRKLVSLGLAAAALLAPAMASAEVARGELRRDRQDIREERREYQQAVRRGSPARIAEERREYRGAVREYREDLSDRRDDRRDDRRAYGRPHREPWSAPFAYRGYRNGFRADASHYGARYRIAHPARFGLAPAYGPTQWVRHYDDALLIDLRTGLVRRVVPNVFW